MDAILPTPTIPTYIASGASPATPFDLETITLTRREHVALKNGVAYYKSLHTRAAQRIEHLKLRHKKEITALQIKYKALDTALDQVKAQLRGLRQQTFGKRDERAKRIKAPLLSNSALGKI
jgi:histidine ammonia-lyase